MARYVLKPLILIPSTVSETFPIHSNGKCQKDVGTINIQVHIAAEATVQSA